MKRARLLLFVLCLFGAGAAVAEGLRSGEYDPPATAPDFSLQGSNGAPLKLSQYRGKVVVLEFGYSHCHAVCPITLSNLAQVFRKLGPAAADVQLVFVTVDPERDSADHLRDFLKHFNPGFVGATGTPQALAPVYASYGVTVTRAAPDPVTKEYDVHHNSSFYLVDREGKLRALVPFGKPPDDIVHDLQLLLAQGRG
jgi:protein SCO1/2